MRRLLFPLLSGLIFAPQALAQTDVEYDKEVPHHLSVVIGGTSVPSANETEFTIGVDYEYRISELLGLGAVVEYAAGDIDATTILAVADIHLWRGLALQIGPGFEIADEGGDTETLAIGRFGALYEFQVGNRFTISPQVHYDISSGQDAVVFGIALGRAF